MKLPILDLSKLAGSVVCNRSPAELGPGIVRLNVDPETPDSAELYIYGDIGNYWGDGVDAQSFIKEIAALDVGTLNVRINSPGGLVFDGVAMYNALAQHSANVVVSVEGLAASIASVIAMAGDEVKIGESANMMIHKPWSWAGGNANDLRKEADVLDHLEEGLIGIYAARTGKSSDDLAKMLADETWMLGKQCVDEGFADTCVPNKTKSAKAAKSQLLACYAHTPSDLLPENAYNPKVRELERLLRDGEGCSNSLAKRIAVLAAQTLDHRDGGRNGPRDEDAKKVANAERAERLAAAIRSQLRNF